MEVLPNDVFAAVRRGYSELESASAAEITTYFDAIDASDVLGHSNHIKGILFEQEYVDALDAAGITASLFDATNHPGTDVLVFGGGDVVTEIQLKATDSVSYVTGAMQDDPEIAFAVTSEVAAQISSDLIIDTGIENAALESAVADTLFDEAFSPIGIFSLARLIIGFPF
ncbi:hypothetical protein O4G76_17375 [Limimaricola sp. G21655-S1]|uniref:hypothetical protein n=1 Tax=Limimaricola sp. G21655-S1 TaxID=3014768 RepID=UPI0022AE93C8|nr:hypothetical protein [Limimaricola sp. G21655-S1]MCZ4262611.1 hypothetical protein [Limimaricola sp. G21655-S1]